MLSLDVTLSVRSVARGRLSRWKLLSNDEFITLKILGSSWALPEDFISRIERFVCSIYGKATGNVKETRYKMYCASSGLKMDSEKLPPCSNGLNLNMLIIWKMYFEPRPVITSRDECACIYEEGHLCIKWLIVGAAPEEILKFMSCSCPRKCTGGKCCCM